MLVTLLDPSLTTAVFVPLLGAAVTWLGVSTGARRRSTASVAALALLAGTLLLVTADAGAVFTVVAMALVLAEPLVSQRGGGGRAILRCGAVFSTAVAGALLVGWLVTGQRVGDLGP